MNTKVLRVSVIAFLAAIICATGFFRVPVPGIESGIVIQNAICILTAVLIGGIFGAAPTALFFIVGVIGLPIFAGWRGGFSVLTEINGGFRIGWVFGALITALIAGKSKMEERKVTCSYVVRITVATLAGMLALYVPEIFYVIAFKSGEIGVDGSALGVSGSLKLFVTAFFAPFLLVDFIKAVVVVLVSIKLRPVVAQYFYPEND